MKSETIQRYRCALAANASSLFDHSPNLPVCFERICAFLKAEVVYSDKVARNQAYLRKENKRGEFAKILLSPSGLGSPYERFYIAHELPHLLLWRIYKAVPHGSSEYWQFEDICDEFARTLLMPEVEVRHRLAAEPRHATTMLKASYRLANLAKAPWAQSAYRISELEHRASFFRIKPQGDGRLKILVSTLPRHKESGRFISLGTSLHEAMVALLREPPARLTKENMHAISPDIMASSNVPSFTNCRECVAVKGPHRDIRLTITTG